MGTDIWLHELQFKEGWYLSKYIDWCLKLFIECMCIFILFFKFSILYMICMYVYCFSISCHISASPWQDIFYHVGPALLFRRPWPQPWAWLRSWRRWWRRTFPTKIRYDSFKIGDSCVFLRAVASWSANGQFPTFIHHPFQGSSPKKWSDWGRPGTFHLRTSEPLKQGVWSWSVRWLYACDDMSFTHVFASVFWR